jgi:hypothetical protein
MESAQPVDQMNQRQQQIEHFHRLMFILCVRAAAAWLVASKLTHEPFQNVCVTAWLFPFYSYIVLALAGTWHCFILSLSFSNLFVYCLFYCRECASASSTCAFNRILASTEASASTPTRARSASAEILTTTDLFVRKVSAAQLFIHLSIPNELCWCREHANDYQTWAFQFDGWCAMTLTTREQTVNAIRGSLIKTRYPKGAAWRIGVGGCCYRTLQVSFFFLIEHGKVRSLIRISWVKHSPSNDPAS